MNDFTACRLQGQMVRRAWFCDASGYYFGKVCPHVDKSNLKFWNGGLLGFLNRWRISIRMTTNQAQAILEDYCSLIIKWL